MNIRNILTEDIISAFLRGLFTGKTTDKNSKLKSVENKFRKGIKKDVDDINKLNIEFRKELNKQRKADGEKPLPKIKKLNVDDVVKDLKNKGQLR